MASTTISPKDVSELRVRTGAGMMDCKRALEESSGDMDKASEILRKKGIAKAEKRTGKTASQGLVVSYIHHNSQVGVLLELNSETDFVARTDDFAELAREIAIHGSAPTRSASIRRDIPCRADPSGRGTCQRDRKWPRRKAGEHPRQDRGRQDQACRREQLAPCWSSRSCGMTRKRWASSSRKLPESWARQSRSGVLRGSESEKVDGSRLHPRPAQDLGRGAGRR